MERVILPIFARTRVNAATQVTAFTLMKESASSNCIPQALDEFKPSKTDRQRLNWLYNHMRDSYDGHAGLRGRADQTQVSYDLLAPLVIAGEQSPDEAAVRERGLELLFSKKDIHDAETREACECWPMGGSGSYSEMARELKGKKTGRRQLYACGFSVYW